MVEANAVQVVEQPGTLPVAAVRSQVNQIQALMKDCMHKDEHYGVVPGTNKPTLLKAGAEKLCLMFRLDPEYEITERYDGDHLTVMSRCVLHHIPTGQRMGSGMGSCSTKESKYAFRNAQRKCPHCGKEAIIKGKQEYGGGWICFEKKGGCKAKFLDGAPEIEDQEVGKVPNEAVADTYNTVLKMANKRSLVAAVLNVTAASDIFTQDMEDTPAAEAAPAKIAPASSSPAQPAPAPKMDPTAAEKMGTEGTIVFRPKEVKPFQRKDGNVQKPYFLIWTPDGVPLETLDAKVANDAMTARRDSCDVNVSYKKGGQGFVITSLIVLDNQGVVQ